jgi:hypothetical protein
MNHFKAIRQFVITLSLNLLFIALTVSGLPKPVAQALVARLKSLST